MKPTRGRPMNISHVDIIEILKKYKNDIITFDRKIVSKLCSIWLTISRELKGKMSPASLYTFVTCNRFNVRTELLKKITEERCNNSNTTSDLNVSITSYETNISDTTINDNSLSYTENGLQTINFIFSMSTAEFDDIIINRTYAYNIRNAKTKCKNASYRQRKVLRPGIWEAVITEKIWNSTNLKCGFNFKNHYIANDAMSGYINGM